MDSLDAALADIDREFAETVAAAEVVPPAEEAEAPQGEVAESAEEQAEVAAEKDGSEEEATAEGEAPAADQSEETPLGQNDDLSSLLEEIPSADTINAKFERVPKTARDEMISMADNWRQDREVINAIGGRETAQSLKAVTDALSKAERSDEDTASALSALASINPKATVEVLFHGATELMFAKPGQSSQEAIDAGNAILEHRFGVDADHIEKLVLLEKGGIIDLEADLNLLHSEGTGSQLFERQQATIDEQKSKIIEMQRLIDNPDLIEKKGAEVSKVDELFEKRFADGIEDVLSRVRWGKESQLAKTVTEAITFNLKNDPDYREAVALAKQGDGKTLPPLVEHRLRLLVNKGKARFIETATAISKDLVETVKTSRNAVVEKKVEEKVKAAPVELAQAHAPGSFGGALRLPDEIARIEREYEEQIRQAR
jgi:hypothetical protein